MHHRKTTVADRRQNARLAASSGVPRQRNLFAFAGVAIVGLACSSTTTHQNEGTSQQMGGREGSGGVAGNASTAVATGGQAGTGGTASSGATSAAVGGSPGPGRTGGVLGSGGSSSVASGGTSAVGGSANAGGGAVVTGGTTTRDAGAGPGGHDAMVGSGGSSGSTLACATGTACVDFSSPQQEIDGFGASSAWSGALSTAVMDASFSNGTNQQMGLSILRVDIDPSGQTHWASQKTNATNAKARGAKYVFGSPWSPPPSMTTNGGTGGGSLKTTSYADFAAYLKSFYDYMGNVDIVSVQNEPNIKVNYLSCNYTADQLYNFALNNAQDIGAPVMMPETYNYDLSYSDPILNDPVAASHVAYIGLHLYGAQMKTYTLAVQKNKKIWMTEFYFNPEDIGTLMKMAKQIMDCFDNQMNAYVWWYLLTPDCNLVNSSGALLNKGYIMAQFSKYIRPGANRVQAIYQPQSNVNVQGFAGTNNVIVALNQNTSATQQSFTIAGATIASFHRYTTSSSKKLSDDGTVTVTNNTFTISLDPQSVTTLVATGAGP